MVRYVHVDLLREKQHSLSPPHRPLFDASLSFGHWLLVTHKPPSRLQASVVPIVRVSTDDNRLASAGAAITASKTCLEFTAVKMRGEEIPKST